MKTFKLLNNIIIVISLCISLFCLIKFFCNNFETIISFGGGCGFGVGFLIFLNSLALFLIFLDNSD